MKTEIGEQIVGAYLKYIKKCDYINYNVKPTSGGIEGLGEFDVIGFDFINDVVYMCEVTTHIRGLNYGDYEITMQKIKDKHKRQKEYATKYLHTFQSQIFMFWSPIVPVGIMTKQMDSIKSIQFIINDEYTKKINELIECFKDRKEDTGNDFIRVIQILQSLRGNKIF